MKTPMTMMVKLMSAAVLMAALFGNPASALADQKYDKHYHRPSGSYYYPYRPSGYRPYAPSRYTPSRLPQYRYSGYHRNDCRDGRAPGRYSTSSWNRPPVRPFWRWR